MKMRWHPYARRLRMRQAAPHEPTGSLDADSAEDISDLLVGLNRSENVTLIVVTHWAKLAEKMRKVLYLSDGCLRERANLE